MPLHTIFRKDGGILLRGDGVLTGGDIIEAKKRFYINPLKIKRIVYQLFDFTGVQEFSITLDDVKLLARLDESAYKINSYMVVALVGDDHFIFNLATIWEAYTVASPLECIVFRDIGDAEWWIDRTFKRVDKVSNDRN